MNRNEINKFLKIISKADGGCMFCVYDLTVKGIEEKLITIEDAIKHFESSTEYPYEKVLLKLKEGYERK